MRRPYDRRIYETAVDTVTLAPVPRGTVRVYEYVNVVTDTPGAYLYLAIVDGDTGNEDEIKGVEENHPAASNILPSVSARNVRVASGDSLRGTDGSTLGGNTSLTAKWYDEPED